MKVLIAGQDGYLGWALTQYLKEKGHKVTGFDNFSRRDIARSLVPLGNREITPLQLHNFDFYHNLKEMIHGVDAIVHLAEIPSAPYSMDGPFKSYVTQWNNVLGTLNLLWAMKENNPDAHLVKLGSMGEFGIQGDRVPENDWSYPKKPGSFYHASKVQDTVNIEFACRNWDFRSTDIMQGVVYGTYKGTRFDYDEEFGTAINRFVVQAIAGEPLTVYGKGAQKRGFLPILDSLQCLTLILENPPEKGVYRAYNQFCEVYELNQLAKTVQKVGNEFKLNVKVNNIKNPRNEKEEHAYEVEHEALKKLGYKTSISMEDMLRQMFKDLIPYKDKINKDKLMPKILWK